MIEVKGIRTLEELQQCMPLFLEGYRAMNRRHKAFECDEEGFIKTLVLVLGGKQNGIFVARVGATAVGYGVAFEDTPWYCAKKHLLLWALYAQPDYSRLASKALFEAAEYAAQSFGYDVMRAYNGRMNGSAFKFFEKILGMRRHKIEFTKQLS